MNERPECKSVRYIVISPVRDEAAHLEKTIESMLQQTVRPTQWILVDDGSCDSTSDIIDKWAAVEPWIVAVHRCDDRETLLNVPVVVKNSSRAQRATEAKEIYAFYDGFTKISAWDWQYLVKLDGDLGFCQDYFERCFREFEADQTLGIGGGTVRDVVNGQLEVEKSPRFHVRGATKIYRRSCWQSIGGVLRAAGWDTLDEVKANMLGWTTRTFDSVHLVHYRPTGAANGSWRNSMKNGLWSYICGYHPLFMLARCVNCMFQKPQLIGSVGLFAGFVSGYVNGIPRVRDESLIRYLRQQQLRRLLSAPTMWN